MNLSERAAPDGCSDPEFAMSELRLRVALTLGLALVSVSSLRADTLYNSWHYAIDSKTDAAGGSTYEEFGLAFRQIGNLGYFAFSGGMPLGGVTSSGALNGKISLGDLYLNFSAHNLDTAAEFNDPNVFAIRFDGSNDSLGNTGSNTTTGVYKNVTVVSLSSPENGGYSTLQSYYNDSSAHRPSSGAMGDLSTTTSVINYLGNGDMYTNISAGTRIGSITNLNSSQLSTLGLDFGHFSAAGANIFGFSFDMSGLPTGSFTAHFFEECINDGVALNVTASVTSQSSTTPEPTSLALAGFAGLGMAVSAWRRRRQQKQAAA